MHRWCDYVSPVWSWTGDPLWRDFADQQTVTWTADILLSNRGVLYRLQRNGWYTKKEVRKSEDVSFSVQSLNSSQRFSSDVINKWWKDFLKHGWWNVTLSITEEQRKPTLNKNSVHSFTSCWRKTTIEFFAFLFYFMYVYINVKFLFYLLPCVVLLQYLVYNNAEDSSTVCLNLYHSL